jgi:hypothetical protein
MVPPQDVYQEPTSEARNRIESRTVEVFLPTHLTDADKWSLVEAIVKVDRHRLIFDPKTKEWRPSDETSFCISTTRSSAQVFCVGIGGHWQIEKYHRGQQRRDLQCAQWSPGHRPARCHPPQRREWRRQRALRYWRIL